MGGGAEVVEFLPDVERNDEEFTVVNITATFEDAGDFQFGGEDHLLEGGDVALGAAGAFDAVDFLEDGVEIPGRIDGDDVADRAAEFAGEFGAEEGFRAGEVVGAGGDEAGDVHDAALELGVDAADFRGEAAVVELDDDGALDERGGGAHGGVFCNFGGGFFPLLEDAGVGDDDMGVEADDLAAEFALEAGHHGDDEDEDHDAEGDAEDGDERDGGEEGALGFEVAQGEEEAESAGHFAGTLHGRRAAGEELLKDNRNRARVISARGSRGSRRRAQEATRLRRGAAPCQCKAAARGAAKMPP